MLLGVAALIRGNSEGAAFLGALAALVKPQFGVVLIPLVAVLLIRRHLLRPGIGTASRAVGSGVAAWLARPGAGLGPPGHVRRRGAGHVPRAGAAVRHGHPAATSS